jgi:hypothetical protein
MCSRSLSCYAVTCDLSGHAVLFSSSPHSSCKILHLVQMDQRAVVSVTAFSSSSSSSSYAYVITFLGRKLKLLRPLLHTLPATMYLLFSAITFSSTFPISYPPSFNCSIDVSASLLHIASVGSISSRPVNARSQMQQVVLTFPLLPLQTLIITLHPPIPPLSGISWTLLWTR